MNRKKIFVLGLDGATFDIIKPMVEAGKLPSFARVMNGGVYGNLRSTILPITPSAWASFMTGKNPGKHGVFGFFTDKCGSNKTEFTTSHSIRARKIWDYFDKDKRVCLIDIPLTYPPQEINGYMISGMPVPSEDSIFTYPPEFHTELISEIGNYMIDKQLSMLTNSNPIDALKSLYDYTEMRMKALRYLLQKKGSFDFSMVVFRGTDFIQHAAFKYFDKDYADRHPEETNKYGKTIFQFYEKIDSYLSEILQLIGDDCNLVIMSDHGAGPLKKLFYINRWLKKEEFIGFKKFQMLRGKGIKWRNKRISNILDKIGFSSINGFLPNYIKKIKIFYFVPYKKHSFSMINWGNTKAYVNRTYLTYVAIKVNLKGREADGCVDESDYDKVCNDLVGKLKDIRDPATGGKVMEAVYRREDIYSGAYLKDAPDILVLTRDINYACPVSVDGDELFETPANPVPATHRMNGIFLAYGPAIKRGINLPENNIVDIAPTILYLMGCGIPEDMDGKAIVDAIDETFLKSNPVVFRSDEEEFSASGGGVEFKDQDRKEIEDNLRALGYFE